MELLRQQDLVLGYLLSTRAKGRYEYFDYLLAYAPGFSALVKDMKRCYQLMISLKEEGLIQ